MSFVKAVDEIARIQRTMKWAEFFDGEAIMVEFESDPDFIAKVLPPGLEPAGNAKMSAGVSRFRGGSCGAYCGGSVQIAARHKDIAGSYTLAMYMNSDNALLFGRDMYGEPKKYADISLATDGPRTHGAITRHGVRLIDIDGVFDQEEHVGSFVSPAFNYKVSFSTDGTGLAFDPILTVCENNLEIHKFLRGKAELKLGGDVHDPLHEIPIAKITTARRITLNCRVRSRNLATVAAADFLPYAYGRMPDWGAFLESWNSGEHGRS